MVNDTDNKPEAVNSEELKARKRQELKEQLEKSKRLAEEDREKLKSM